MEISFCSSRYDEPDVVERARRRLEAARSSRRDGACDRKRVANPAAVSEPTAAEPPVLRERQLSHARRGVFSSEDEHVHGPRSISSHSGLFEAEPLDDFEQPAAVEEFEQVATAADALPRYEVAQAKADGHPSGRYVDVEWVGVGGRQCDEQQQNRHADGTTDDDEQVSSSEEEHDDEEEARRQRQWERQQPRAADEERRRWECQQPRAVPSQQPQGTLPEPTLNSPESREERKRIEKVGAIRGRRPSTVFKLGNMMGDLRGQLASLKGLSISIAGDEGARQAVHRMGSIDSENSVGSS